jgi:SAM-dependent methyltransferase
MFMRVLHEMGFEVLAYDLFPGSFRFAGVPCYFTDLSQPLPLGDEAVDLVICQEGIEHMPSPLSVLEEFNRVLKSGGTLILTTPNNSHLRARVSRLLVGSELAKRLPPSEIDSVWMVGQGGRLYFGHLFLLEANQLWVLARLAGFDVVEKQPTKVSTSSAILGVFLAPLIALFTLRAYYKSSRKQNPERRPARQELLRQQLRLNLSPKTLFCKHLFWILKKRDSLAECREELRQSVGETTPDILPE